MLPCKILAPISQVLLAIPSDAAQLVAAAAAASPSPSFYKPLPASSTLPTATANALIPLAFKPLPLSSIKAWNWLDGQLSSLESGLAGHLAEFYLFVNGSSWLGGPHEYSDLNEGFPYWFNGIVPLTYASLGRHPRLLAQINRTTSYILSHQSADGWIGPEQGNARNLWARMPVMLGLMQLAEADPTWAPTVIPAMHKFVALMHTMLANNYTGYIYHQGDKLSEGDYAWGRVRSQDMMVSLQWLYEHHPDGQENVLLGCMTLLHKGSIAWESWYNSKTLLPFQQDLNDLPDSLTGPNFPYEHGVNVGQGLKAAAVVRRLTQNDSLIQTAMLGVNFTFSYHAAASGGILADERLVGLSPYYGTELCTNVEAMYSLSYIYQALGNNIYADLCERIAFNALPVMLTEDSYAHQYVAQPNQPWSKHLQEVPFSNTNNLSQTYGLEPNYPCCTVNHAQGYPKYVANSFVEVADGRIAHVLLGPAKLDATTSAGSIQIVSYGQYPYSDFLPYRISTNHDTTFSVRLPTWSNPDGSGWLNLSHPGMTLTPRAAPDTHSGLDQIKISEGESQLLCYQLNPTTRIEPRANNTVAIYRGALLYALAIDAEKTSSTPRNYGNQSAYDDNYAPPQARDWTYTNASAWSVAIDTSTLNFHRAKLDGCGNFTDTSIKEPDAIWFTVKACEIEWPLLRGSVPGAAPPLASRQCLGDAFEVRLIPYGQAKLHMSEMPTIDLSSQ